MVFRGDTSQGDFWFAKGHNYVDVRDLADAHIKALEVEGAGNERLIVASGPSFLFVASYRPLTCPSIYGSVVHLAGLV